MADDALNGNTRPWIVAVCNQKGGVGKTTAALNLASVFADSSGRVQVVDAGPQRSAAEFAAAAGDLVLSAIPLSDYEAASTLPAIRPAAIWGHGRASVQGKRSRGAGPGWERSALR
jgi:nitrogenase subunit NifH